MPNPGTVNNKQGANGLYGVTEAPQGAIKRLEQQTQAAPLAPNAALASPKRAQRAAVRGRQDAPPVFEPHPPNDVQPAAVLAQVWQELAATPGASPLLVEYARKASGA